MAEYDNSEGAVANGDLSHQPQIALVGQYVKDFSFENPGAPQSIQSFTTGNPKIDINVGVSVAQAASDGFEVSLKLEARASIDDSAAFIVELVYCGLFAMRNLPQEQIEPFLLIEAPRLLFPFARRIVADAVRDGGFPPLMLEPVDFAGLYRQSLQQRQGEAATGQA